MDAIPASPMTTKKIDICQGASWNRACKVGIEAAYAPMTRPL